MPTLKNVRPPQHYGFISTGRVAITVLLIILITNTLSMKQPQGALTAILAATIIYTLYKTDNRENRLPRPILDNLIIELLTRLAKKKRSRIYIPETTLLKAESNEITTIDPLGELRIHHSTITVNNQQQPTAVFESQHGFTYAVKVAPNGNDLIENIHTSGREGFASLLAHLRENTPATDIWLTITSEPRAANQGVTRQNHLIIGYPKTDALRRLLQQNNIPAAIRLNIESTYTALAQNAPRSFKVGQPLNAKSHFALISTIRHAKNTGRQHLFTSNPIDNRTYLTWDGKYLRVLVLTATRQEINEGAISRLIQAHPQIRRTIIIRWAVWSSDQSQTFTRPRKPDQESLLNKGKLGVQHRRAANDFELLSQQQHTTNDPLATAVAYLIIAADDLATLDDNTQKLRNASQPLQFIAPIDQQVEAMIAALPFFHSRIKK